MKKTFIILFTIILSCILITGCKNKNKAPEVIINNNQEVTKDQEFDGLTFKKTSLSTVNGISTLVTEVTNNTNEDYKLVKFNISFYDENDKLITVLPGYIGDVLKKGESININSSIDEDLSSAVRIEYNVEK